MDIETISKIFNWLWVPLYAAAGWLLKRLRDIDNNADKMRNDMNTFKVDVAKNYTPRQEHLDAYNRVDGKLDRILDKLDGKADKRGK